MNKQKKKNGSMHTYSHWLMGRGLVLACVIQGLALLLAMRSGGLSPDTVYLWECIDYLSGSALTALGVALIGGLLLEEVLSGNRDPG